MTHWTSLHIPDIPEEYANGAAISTLVEKVLFIGITSRIDIVKRNGGFMAFIHFSFSWRNGENANKVRDAIAEKGYYEHTFPDQKKIRIIESKTPKTQPQQQVQVQPLTITPDNINIQHKSKEETLIEKNAFTVKAQSALISQLIKELKEEREKNHKLEERLSEVFQILYSAVKYDGLDIPKELHLEDLCVEV